MATWLGILWGNTHHQWGWFEGANLLSQQRFRRDEAPLLPSQTDICLAPVGQGSLPTSERVRVLTLADVPLLNPYATLGLDRALALVAAGQLYGWPVLVIDAGTALTFSAAIEVEGQGSFWGGAILPGLGLQAHALAQGTAALPLVRLWGPAGSGVLPQNRWATDTTSAIQSGILNTVISGIRDFITDWRQHYPQGRVVFTGGDGSLLAHSFAEESYCHWDPTLVLKGIPYCGCWPESRE